MSTKAGQSRDKYLARWAEAEVRAGSLEGLAQHGPWQHTVVIPVRRERAEDCLAVVAAPAASGRLLCVLVVNAADDPEDQASARTLLAALERWPKTWEAGGLSLHAHAGYDLLVVDACRGERSFAARDGVGRARKLGCDLAVALERLGAVRGGWIHNTDADAILSAEHCERAGRAEGEPVAVVAPFWHIPGGDRSIDAATAAYELELRYYVAGLHHARSRYAFHTIGSTISVRSSAYVAVRGCPRRQAGEDFYLLNKLAKVGPVACVAGAPVSIRARRSMRVPFGTGPAVEAMLAGASSRVYDPRVFAVVGELEAALHEAAGGGGLTRLQALVRTHQGDALHRCEQAMQALVDRYPLAQLGRRLHEAFDGFHTLKLIHELTRSSWPKLGWAEAVAAAPFLDFDATLGIEEQRRALLALEQRGLGPRPS